MTRDAKKKLAVTPAKSRTPVGNSPCLVRTKLKTNRMAPSAPMNENKEITGILLENGDVKLYIKIIKTTLLLLKILLIRKFRIK